MSSQVQTEMLRHKHEYKSVPDKPPGIPETYITLIDKGLAERLMSKSKRNRPLRGSHVSKLGRDYDAGKWELNGSAIIRSRTNNIIDGQHRLAMVIEKDAVIETVFVDGVDDSAFVSLGEQYSRTPGHNFAYHAVPNATVAAAISALVWYWDSGNLAGYHSVALYPNKQEIYQAYLKYQSEIDEAVNNRGVMGRLLTGSLTGFFWFLFGRVDKTKRDLFFQQLSTGLHLSEGMATYSLRRKLEYDALKANGKRAVSHRNSIAIVIKTWNAFLEDRKFRTVAFKTGEDFPTIGGLQ